MSFLDNINGVSSKTIKSLSDAGKDKISDEFKGIIDFCVDDNENIDSYSGNGYEGNGLSGNGYEGNGFEVFGGNGFEDIGGNGFEDFGTNGYEGNGFAELGGNGENLYNDYNFDEEMNDFWQEG
ncbi:hypothetical protein IJ425_02555 [bacterium]|nr:hypothetical protein [bacterium]